VIAKPMIEDIEVREVANAVLRYDSKFNP
jgi:hypothetical protein